MIEIFAEYGAIGVVIALFAGQILFLQKTLMGKLKEIDDKVIALINRWNRSDETTARHREDIVKEMNDVSDGISFLKGRINGSAR
ncbi:MAG: hypothetical protein Unbinned400contig1004_15 [Prokaryotic dsDNA virus sp.]|nr:MAG: hypothetical protein Unbinned400contig1004_15 [Prokaryotic dsDNA virus sp.]|tara:strand:- start:12198 stop:12452 length:255 start_codon:yes stop_codon:yes gene_type:complete